MARVRSIGRTAEGRDIPCLTVERPGGRKPKANVVVIGRMHPNESSGGYAVEASARFALSQDAPAGWLRDYAFHFIPTANPDGAANGTKLTQTGPVIEYDMVQGGMTSDDPTIRSLREELLGLRPAVMISHHAYLMSSPFLGTFEKQVGLDALDALVPREPAPAVPWLWRQTGGPEARTLRYALYERFNTTSVITELPWAGRLPKDIEQLGVDVFRATMHAHALKIKKRRRR